MPVTEPIVAWDCQYHWALIVKASRFQGDGKEECAWKVETNLSGALDVLCMASDEAGVLVVVITVGLGRHCDLCMVYWLGI